MFGISIDDEPSNPVGTPEVRQTVAIHWNWTTEYTQEEMASALGVTRQTVQRYLSEGPTEAVREQMHGVEKEVRMVAVAELKEQLQAAGQRSRSAEKPVKVWPEDGQLHVVDKVDEQSGKIVDKYALPESFELGKDGKTRYFAREEVREILEQLVDITGAAEPERQEIEHKGDVGVGLSDADKEALGEMLNAEPET